MSLIQAPPMPGHRYVEVISLAAMLPTMRLAGVTPELNLREFVICVPLSSVNKTAHSGFEIQERYHQKSKTGVSKAPQNGPMSSKILKKKQFKTFSSSGAICVHNKFYFVLTYATYKTCAVIILNAKYLCW